MDVPLHAAALEKERAAHAREKEEKSETIARLKDELQQLKNDVATRRKFAAKESAAGTAAKQRAYIFTEASLQQQLAELRKKKEMDDAVHTQMVTFLKKQHEV